MSIQKIENLRKIEVVYNYGCLTAVLYI